MSFEVVPVDKPADMNVIIGQAHFIKTVEDLHETLAGVSPHLRFGLAFCEASAARLVDAGDDGEPVAHRQTHLCAIWPSVTLLRLELRRLGARLPSASRSRSAITVPRGCADVRRCTCPPRRTWRGTGRVSACPCRYPAARPRWSGVPHLPAGHGQHGQGRWPAIDLPAGCSAKSAQRPVRGLAPAFRGTGNIAATGREAVAPPGESAGAERDRVADGCSGDVSCAARSSGRGP